MPKQSGNNIVKIKRLHRDAKVPHYEHLEDSGSDICAVEDATLKPLERKAVPTGLSVEVEGGFELQVRPKSGLALNHGITVLNTPGTVDAGYRGELRIILINLSSQEYKIEVGQKIAQLVLAPVAYADFEEVEVLSPSSRGTRGFGSSGKF